jgi:serine/threonine-protein kinase
MDSLQAHPLNGTEGISGAPIWSPDSGSFAFGVGNELKKIELAGSSVRTLGTSKTPVGSGSWSKEDVIVFGGRGAGGLQQIPSSGGTAQALTIASRGFHTFPWFLPDGRRFLYLVTAPLSIHIGSLDSKPEEQSNAPLLTGTSDAMYLPGPDPFVGHLLYTRNATLMAHPFDANLLQVSGEPVPIADRIAAPNPILSFFSISMNGVLSYRSGDGLARTLVLRDRKGTDTPIASDPLDARNPRLSPDGKRVALIVGGDLWVFDLGGRPPIKLTFGREAATPLWTKDGKRLIFETNTVDPEFQGARGQSVNSGSLLSVAADGSNPALERASPEGHFHAYGWSPADELIAVKYGEGGRNTDIVKMSPAEKAQVLPVVQTPAPEGGSGMSLSSDSRWLAYSADTTGAFEIWVRAFGEAGAPIRVSPNGGSDPVWSRNGRELFYIQGSRLMAVEVDTRSGFTFKSPVSLFDIAPEAGTQPSAYDVTEDGRFVFLRSSTGVSTPVTLVFDWTSKLKKKTE